MRTIKFRGKRLDGSGWVYGDLIHENNGKVAIKTNLDTWDENDDNIEPYGEYVLVKSYTVGQYIWLNDINGKSIYEGDIVRGINARNILVVEWDEEYSEFMMVDKTDYQQYSIYQECEIIGNIHDNPELPEGGNE